MAFCVGHGRSNLILLTMTEVSTIPPPEIAFRIVDHSGQYVLAHGQQKDSPQSAGGDSYHTVKKVSATTTTPDADPDLGQYWSLEPSASSPGVFIIGSKLNDRVLLFVRGSSDPLRIIPQPEDPVKDTADM
jgi:hypothetical protein